jgi:hypothetical protein
LRRIGSNIRKQNSDARANRIVRNIIRYTDEETARNDYPRKIVSPVQPSTSEAVKEYRQWKRYMVQ